MKWHLAGVALIKRLSRARATVSVCAVIVMTLTVAFDPAAAVPADQGQGTEVAEANRQAPATEPLNGPHCFDRPYAPEKRLPSNAGATGRNRNELERDADDIRQNDGHILQRDRELPPPPEILRIRRGYVESFTGTFINDGLQHWDGVDLDRDLVVVVQRRIHDQRSALSRPFADPTFPSQYHSGIIFGRKFESSLRTELEVVSVLPLDRDQLEAFVCLANAAWAAVPQAPTMISDGFISGELLDEELRGQEQFTFRKSVYSGALEKVLRQNLEQYMPQPTW